MGICLEVKSMWNYIEALESENKELKKENQELKEEIKKIKRKGRIY